jgi:hypothetical protein
MALAAINALSLLRMQHAPVSRGPDVPVGDADDDGEGGGGWVTIASFLTPFEANLARLKLESADIDCVLLDENIAMTQAFGIMTGGVKLKVPALQADDARELLKLDFDPSLDAEESQAEPIDSHSTSVAPWAYLVVPALLIIAGVLAVRFPVFAVVALMLGVFSLAACTSPYLRTRREHEDSYRD